MGETEFARDPAFGYRSSALREFIAERSGGAVRPEQVARISLADIRLGGPAGSPGGWPRCPAAAGWWWTAPILRPGHGGLRRAAGRAGRPGVPVRTGPSFVRALLGQDPQPPLRGARIWPPGHRSARDGGHGLIVVGSHVGQTSRQLAALRARPGIAAIELDVPAVLRGAGDVAAATARQAAAALRQSAVLLYTSRTVATGRDAADSLAIARTVSAALAQLVRDVLAAGPAWVLAKGGITAHDVATRGLGIRRALVAGRCSPG